jgi:proline iminopeptidase
MVVNGHRLWYRIAGTGQPLLVIPGGPGTSHSYLYPAFEDLADSAQVIYFDAFGRGQSGRAASASEYSLRNDIDDIEGLRKALNVGQVAVYGQSYGGVVAQGYATTFPRSVKKLILANTAVNGEMWQRAADNLNREIQNQFPEVWSELQRLRAAKSVTCDAAYQAVQNRIPASLAWFYDPSSSDVQFDFNLDVFCQIAGRDGDFAIGGDLVSFDFTRQLRDLRIPTLVLAGRFDRFFLPRDAMEFRALMPHAEFVLFERSGHSPFIEERDRHSAVVREFLAK